MAVADVHKETILASSKLRIGRANIGRHGVNVAISRCTLAVQCIGSDTGILSSRAVRAATVVDVARTRLVISSVRDSLVFFLAALNPRECLYVNIFFSEKLYYTTALVTNSILTRQLSNVVHIAQTRVESVCLGEKPEHASYLLLLHFLQNIKNQSKLHLRMHPTQASNGIGRALDCDRLYISGIHLHHV